MPVIPVTTPTGVALVLEPRALLDVQLDERVDVVAPRLREPLRVEPDRRHRLADRDAVVVAHLVEMLAPGLARDRARAPEAGRVEARAPPPRRARRPRACGAAGRPAPSAPARPRSPPRSRARRRSGRPASASRRASRGDHGPGLGSLEPPPDVADRVAPDLEPRRRAAAPRPRPARPTTPASRRRATRPSRRGRRGARARGSRPRPLRGRSRSIDLPRVPAAGGLRQRDGEDQRAAVEELLHEGLHAEELEPRDAGDEEVDGRDRAERVEAPGEDRRRAEERRRERGQQEAEARGRVGGAERARVEDAGEGADQRRSRRARPSAGATRGCRRAAPRCGRGRRTGAAARPA